MINIRQDLIEKELAPYEKQGYIYHKFHLHNSLISKLYNHYNLMEMCENYYDSEPDFDDEEYNMYLDYKENINMTGLSFWNIVSRSEELSENKKFSTKEHTKEEIFDAYQKVSKIYEDYETKRIEFNNWQEPYFVGNWNYSQNYINNVARRTLLSIKRSNVSKKNRLYICQKEDIIEIYFYGRDYLQIDYWFVFKKIK